jgi:hypothetical protein
MIVPDVTFVDVSGANIDANSTQPARGPTDVEQLCQRLGIHDLAEVAMGLVKKNLKPERIRLEAAGDPEGDGEWLVIRAEVHGRVDEVLDRYSTCKQEWIRLAPASKRGLVRFLYNIL